MSLQVDESGRRGRSRSPSGRERSSTRIERSPSGRHRDRDERDAPSIVQAPYPANDGGDGNGDDDGYSGHSRSTRIPDYNDYRIPAGSSRAPADAEYTDGRREKEYRYEKAKDRTKERSADDDKFAYLPAKYAKTVDIGRDRPRSSHKSRGSNSGVDDADLVYGSGAVPPASSRPSSTYAYDKPKQWEYAKTETYTYGDPVDRDDRKERTATREEKKHHRESYGADPRTSTGNTLTVEPPHRSRDKSRERSRERSRSPIPGGRDAAARLSVNTLSLNPSHHGSNLSVATAPGSPLLESYHGTYQSMSPMPSPLMLASQGPGSPSASELRIIDSNGPDSDDEHATPTTPGGSGGGGEKIRRRARFYDPETDAERLAKALRGDRHPPDVGPLIEVLPGLTHNQVMELRVEYKRIVKTGPDRRGVNIAKHIRARLKDEDPALMKACYATALGRWESEAYWANFWYHGDKTRRELLIESLMGRTNDEIRRIKEGFNDKKYADSLSKCMRTELKEDKFKRAVLFVLDEQRMEEFDRNGRPLPIDRALVEEDAGSLYRAIRAEKGGETAMINVVVQRSDSHLREVLRFYSSQYKSNFARDCLRKSGNLVGEMLAHILNGVINKPVRDALLVHHALTASKRDELRRELLISRLVRFHWDRHHMSAIKASYRSRYNRDMQEAIRDATGNSDWGLFCRELCITRHPDDVKRVERIEIRDERRG